MILNRKLSLKKKLDLSGVFDRSELSRIARTRFSQANVKLLTKFGRIMPVMEILYLSIPLI